MMHCALQVAQGAAEDKVEQLEAQLQATKLSAKKSQMNKASQTTLPAVVCDSTVSWLCTHELFDVS